MSVFPIGESIDASKVVNEIPIKRQLLSPLIPGNMSTYIYNNETDYYNNYKESFFAITHKKAGWDCLRHYEILANGCIPYFPDIKQCPKNTMCHFPKNIIIKTNELYESILNKINSQQIT